MVKIKFIFYYILFFVIILSSILLTVNTKWEKAETLSNQKNDLSKKFEAEKAPKIEISLKEQEVNNRRSKRLIKANESQQLKKTNFGQYSYAGGLIKGDWIQKEFLVKDSKGNGYRTIYSAYDKVNDKIYVVTYAGHLYRIDRDELNSFNTKWVPLNTSESFMSERSKLSLNVLNTANGNPILVRAGTNKKMQYSLDEGKTWLNSTGINVDETFDKSVVIENNQGSKLVSIVKSNNKHRAIVTSNGSNYSDTGFELDFNTFETKILKPSNTNDAYIIAREKNNNKVSTYRMDANQTSFQLINITTDTSITSLTNTFGTRVNNKTYLYLSSKNIIHLSVNNGNSWVMKNNGNFKDTQGNRNSRSVHPNKPGVIFRGYLDTYISIDEGKTFSGTKHRLGWDMHFMKVFEKSNGEKFHLISGDFGVYISYTPDDFTSYIGLNNRASNVMAYDSDASDLYKTAYFASQDRGTRSFKDIELSGTTDFRSTDGLRVTLANKEKSAWSLLYFGTLYHESNIGYQKGPRSSIQHVNGNWQGTMVVESPNENEDAVFLGGYTFLKKYTYSTTNNKISLFDHPIDFGQTITGFGYSQVNRNKWYVSLKNGDFYYSTDGGNSFTPSSYGGVKPSANDGQSYTRRQHIIKTSLNIEGRVYYAGVGETFLISNDGGVTFTNHINGLDVFRFRDFEVTPDDKFIFAACALGGIWVYSVDNNIWYEMAQGPIPYVDFTSVEYLPSSKSVLFGSHGSGILSFEMGDPFDCNGIQGGLAKIDACGVCAGGDTGIQPILNPKDCLPCKDATDRSNWSIASVSGQQTNYEAELAIDNDPNSFWHSQWSPVADNYPHNMVIDLGKQLEISGVHILSRQDGSLNGLIQTMEISVSDDVNIPSNIKLNINQDFEIFRSHFFNQPQVGRYLHIKALTELSGKNFATISDVNICASKPIITSTPINMNELTVTIAPNPFHNFIKIKSPWFTGKYRIINSLGAIVLSGIISGPYQLIDTKNILPGSYIVEVSQNHNFIRKTIIK